MTRPEFLLSELDLWFDAEERTGPENMAIDEWLLARPERPVLRVYRWEPGWGSFGCFGNHAAANDGFPGLRWVRRFTGGGTVDHRDDWTYTLAIPICEALANQRGAESYRLIHQALAQSLEDRSGLAAGGDGPPGGVCFQNPVRFDLVGEDGAKVAGAGQRRTKSGLLHQGSVAGRLDLSRSLERTTRLAAILSKRVGSYHPAAEMVEAVGSLAVRYGDDGWTAKR